jgi:shikimate dehydrogenase
MGMEGFPPVPIRLETYPENTIVIELVYHPLETPLLRQAREQGLQTVDGLSLLIAQAADAFRIFFDHPAPRQYDAELRELLTR